MSYFPASVYDAVFADRRVPAATRGPEPSGKGTPGSGFFHRFARLFGRPNQHRHFVSKETEELWEYHNPTLGVRDFRPEA